MILKCCISETKMMPISHDLWRRANQRGPTIGRAAAFNWSRRACWQAPQNTWRPAHRARGRHRPKRVPLGGAFNVDCLPFSFARPLVYNLSAASQSITRCFHRVTNDAILVSTNFAARNELMSERRLLCFILSPRRKTPRTNSIISSPCSIGVHYQP